MKVWLEMKLYRHIISESRKFSPLETGGMLIGYKDIYKNLVITNLIEAGPNALRFDNMFMPDGKYQQNELSKIFIETNGVHTFLGDWHSHPNSSAYMSELDLKTIKEIANSKAARTPNPIFLIFGTIERNIKCWRYVGKRNYSVEQLMVDFY
jgi:integrative and conjugative element protein (TIGR02256 family)